MIDHQTEYRPATKTVSRSLSCFATAKPSSVFVAGQYSDCRTRETQS
jgi:hypothetical protein